MGNPFYMAMTAAEFFACEQLPAHVAWMACHFSPYGIGLSNPPTALPPGSILILNDRIPPHGHDPKRIVDQLLELVSKFRLDGILLDFQRPMDALTERIVANIISAMPEGVAVSHHYGADLCCPVFVPPPPIRCDPETYIKKWQGREIWMEAYEQWETVTVTADRVTVSEEPQPDCPTLSYYDETLRCHYRIDAFDDKAIFTLHRGLDELRSLPFPIMRYIGLYQEYQNIEGV